MPLKEIRTEFTPAPVAHVESRAKLSHTVSRGTLSGSNKEWINKEMPDPAIARSEILAQEFFRLIIPHQGETRLLQNNVNGVHHILSEEVPGYRPLPRGEAANFANGRYTGLGQALVCAMFVQEVDLKNGNIGLDARGRVAKIDGDWSFGGIRKPGSNYPITPAAIEKLPYPTGFYAFNWLDMVMQGVAHPRSHIVDMQLANSPQFRAEVNQALLKIALLPDNFIGQFVDAYMPAGGERFVDLIKSRQNRLLISALQNESFLTYLKSDQAKLDVLNLTTHINSFQANGEGSVVPRDACNITAEQVGRRFEFITSRFNLEVNENKKLIKDILKNASDKVDLFIGGLKDLELVAYAKQMNKRTQAAAHDKDQLNLIKIELTAKRDELAQARLLLIENKQLIGKIDDCKVNYADLVLRQYVDSALRKLKAIKQEDLAGLTEMKTELTRILAFVSSPQAKAVIHAAESLRESTHWYTHGKTTKAELIEEALCNTPLEERASVITKEGPANPVQEALAARKSLVKGVIVPKRGEELDVENASKMFKNLKEQFRSQKEGIEAGADDANSMSRP